MQAVTNFTVCQHYCETPSKISLKRYLVQSADDSDKFSINWVLNVYHSHPESQNFMDIEGSPCTCSSSGSTSPAAKVQDCALSLLGIGHVGLESAEVYHEVLFFNKLSQKHTSHASQELKERVYKHYPITDEEKVKVCRASDAVLNKIIDIDFLASEKLRDN